MQINKEQNIKEETKNTKKIYQEIIRKNLKKYIVSKIDIIDILLII